MIDQMEKGDELEKAFSVQLKERLELEKKDEKDTIEMKSHVIWFTDAATIFNILRFSDEYQTEFANRKSK